MRKQNQITGTEVYVNPRFTRRPSGSRAVTGFICRPLNIAKMDHADREYFVLEAKRYLYSNWKINATRSNVLRIMNGQHFVKLNRKSFKLIPKNEMIEINNVVQIFDEETYNFYNN